MRYNCAAVPPRKNIHLQRGLYKGRRRYFVTICCAKRKRVFSNPNAAGWIEGRLLAAAAAYNFRLQAWCVMPDHIHFLVEGMKEECDLLAFVTRFKQRSDLAWRGKLSVPLWQRNFYEHILRRPEEASKIAAYIWMNPVRKGICSDAREYAFSGSISFDWRKATRIDSGWRPPWLKEEDHSGRP